MKVEISGSEARRIALTAQGFNALSRNKSASASDLAGSKASRGMWVWSEAKHALEWLFWAGALKTPHCCLPLIR